MAAQSIPKSKSRRTGPLSSPRNGWNAAFARMRARGDDALLDVNEDRHVSSWDTMQWKW
jgi:hypothetical protein